MKYEVRQDIPGRIHIRLAAGRLSAADADELERRLRGVPGFVSLAPYRHIGEVAVSYMPSCAESVPAVRRVLSGFEPTGAVVRVNRAGEPGRGGSGADVATGAVVRIAAGAVADALLPLPARIAAHALVDVARSAGGR